jgi:hypothetical protein
MITHKDRLFTVPTTKLRDIRYCRSIKAPENIFVEKFYPVREADFYAIGKQIVLSQKVALLNLLQKLWFMLFSNRHLAKGPLRASPPLYARSLKL